MASAAKILSVEKIEARAGTVALALGGITVGGRAGGISATVETTGDIGATSTGAAFADGRLTLGLSKLDGESEWIVDSLTVGSFPVFANGVGSRCTLLKKLTDGELIAQLDEAAGALA